MVLTEAERQALITRIERAGVAAWPALETVRDGGWLWRFAKGYTKRANSIQSMARSDDHNATARILRLAERSEDHGIRPVFRVTPISGTGITAALDGLGWAPFEQSFILTRKLIEPVAMPDGAEILPATAPRWHEAQALLQGHGQEIRDILESLTAKMPAEAAGIVISAPDGTPAASLLMSVAGGIGFFLNVITAPQFRRQGYARTAMLAGLAHAANVGADRAALMVLAANAPARALYAGAGFEELGAYHYRAAPQ